MLVPVLMVMMLFMVKVSWPMIVLLLLGMFAMFVVNLIMNQESMLYAPAPAGTRRPDENPPQWRNPSEKGLEYEDVYFLTQDEVRINAWFIEAESNSKTAPTIVFFHANAGNIGHRLPNFEMIVQKLEANIFAIDYRGYGCSEGSPSEEGLIEDAWSAWKWIQKAAEDGRIDGKKIFMFGRSLGGAVTIALNAKLQSNGQALPCGVILENTFTSIPDLVDTLFPWIPVALKNRYCRLSWRSIDRIVDLKIPFLFLAGVQDEIVPHSHMLKLLDGASASPYKDMLKVPDGKHNDTFMEHVSGERYWRRQKAFIDRCTMGSEFPAVDQIFTESSVSDMDKDSPTSVRDADLTKRLPRVAD